MAIKDVFNGFGRRTGAVWNFTHRFVQGITFRLFVAVALVFGTFNTWGFSGYDWFEYNIMNYWASWTRADMLNFAGLIAAGLGVWIVLWLIFSAEWRNRIFTAYVGASVLLAAAYIVAYTDWLQLVLAAMKLALFAFFWVLLVQTSIQLMGKRVFVLFAIFVGLGTIAGFAGLRKVFTLPVDFQTITWTVQAGLAILLMGGIIFPSFRKGLMGLGSVMTPERSTEAGHGTADDGHSHGQDAGLADHSATAVHH